MFVITMCCLEGYHLKKLKISSGFLLFCLNGHQKIFVSSKKVTRISGTYMYFTRENCEKL